MKYFCVPADFKKETIDQYDHLNQVYPNSKVIETYGSLSVGNNLGSGRSYIQIPKVDFLDLYEYIQYSKKKCIEFNYTINAPHILNIEYTKDGAQKIIELIHRLYEAGCRSLTVALPSVVELIKSTGLDFKIKASTICEITSLDKALGYKNLGMDRIVVDESINRKFFLLNNIVKECGEKVEVIVNPPCYSNCIYRMFHYNQIANDSINRTNEVSNNYFEHRCMLQRYSKISNILKISWIRPEDLVYYTNIGIKYFKIAGRDLVLKGDPIKTLKAYFDETFDGDIMDLINMFCKVNSFNIPVDNKSLDNYIKPFYENKNFCTGVCKNCNHCEEFSRKAINYDQAENIKKSADEFYTQCDQYNILLAALEKENKKDSEIDQKIDFSLD